MDLMLFSGVFDLPWWGHVIVALVLPKSRALHTMYAMRQRAGGGVEALDGHARATGQAAPGLVPPGRGERHPAVD
jgi:hypothetical protein